MEKYYTPKIEEFHIGFEFEALNSNDWFFQEDISGWKKITLNQYNNRFHFNLSNIEGGIQVGWIRVKHLDKEDIESLGWKEEERNCFSFYDYKESYLLFFPEQEQIRVEIGDNENCNGFAGTIKNKSELKKLMKQMNIWKNVTIVE